MLQIFQGTFTANTGTGNQTISGIVDQAAAAFTPKAILIWTTYQTGAGFTDEQVFQKGLTDGVQQASHYARASDNDSPNDTDRAVSVAAVVAIRNLAGTNVRVGTIGTISSGQFVINWTTADGSAQIFHFLAIGGSDVNCRVGTGTTSDLATSGLVFPGDAKAVILFQAGSSGDFGANHPAVGFIAIAEDGVTVTQACASVMTEDAQATSDTWRYQRDDRCGVIQAEGTGAEFNALTFSVTGGLVLAAGTGNVTFAYLAIGGSGVSAKVGSALQPTTTGTQAISGLGFEPAGVLLMSVGQTPQSTVQTETRFSFGAMTAAAQGVGWIGNLDAQNPSVSARRHATTKCLTMSTPAATGSSSTTEAEAEFDSLDADGFTLDWTTADATQRQYLYLALGEGAGGAGGGVMGARIFTGY
jgi:hypothetical protein